VAGTLGEVSDTLGEVLDTPGGVSGTHGGVSDTFGGVSGTPEGGSRLCLAGHDGEGACLCEDGAHSACQVQGHRDVVKSVAFSGDGGRIVSGSWDGSLKVLSHRKWLESRFAEVDSRTKPSTYSLYM